MSLSSTYVSVKELLANNLKSKGVDANKTEGLTTLSNKVLQINSIDKTFFSIDDKFDIFSHLQPNYCGEIAEPINDGSDGISNYENYSENHFECIKRIVTGWSNHEIIDVLPIIIRVAPNFIDLSTDKFVLDVAFLTQDGFENPGVFISNDDKFYQMFLWDDGGYYGPNDSTNIHKICIGKNKYIVTDRMDLVDSEIINVEDLHHMRLFYLRDKILFEFYASDSSNGDITTYRYALPVSDFTPTKLGLSLGYKGSRDYVGNVIVFSELRITKLS